LLSGDFRANFRFAFSPKPFGVMITELSEILFEFFSPVATYLIRANEQRKGI
jgi:hypothetical protein